jgi:PHD/YefM family antitoxin component YafN of YafNO toxin-antitoxin module
MHAPQIIRTPGGEELVVLPRADYEALLERADGAAEDADDVAIYDARKAELAAGGVVLPPEVKAELTHAFAQPESSYEPLTASQVIERNRP